MTAPLRQNKHDRLFHGHSVSREEIAVDHAVAPFDAMAREMNARWGTDRLVALVSPETAAKYGRTLGSLNAAIGDNDADRAADRAAACIRGMEAMDREARALGHVPPISGVIVHETDGFRFGVLPNADLWRQAEAEYPGLPIYNLQEIGVMIREIDSKGGMIAAFKSALPGAQVIDIRSRGPLPEDEIPF